MKTAPHSVRSKERQRLGHKRSVPCTKCGEKNYAARAGIGKRAEARPSPLEDALRITRPFAVIDAEELFDLRSIV